MTFSNFCQAKTQSQWQRNTGSIELDMVCRATCCINVNIYIPCFLSALQRSSHQSLPHGLCSEWALLRTEQITSPVTYPSYGNFPLLLFSLLTMKNRQVSRHKQVWPIKPADAETSLWRDCNKRTDKLNSLLRDFLAEAQSDLEMNTRLTLT